MGQKLLQKLTPGVGENLSGLWARDDWLWKSREVSLSSEVACSAAGRVTKFPVFLRGRNPGDENSQEGPPEAIQPIESVRPSSTYHLE